MNKIQEDTLNMYQATDDVLQTHNAVWAANIPFAAAVTELENNIDSIEDLQDIQLTDTTGVAESKQNKRLSLEDQTFAAGRIIAFYASTINDPDLQKRINFTRSELKNARDNELPSFARKVHSEAVANAAAVLPFGLTGPMTTALGVAIDDYDDLIDKPRSAKGRTSAATEQLPPLFDDTTTLLTEQLDGGMELYRVSNPDFYTQYFNARIIVNSPTQKRALEVHFTTGDDTNTPLEHVSVLVDGSINRRSSSLGNIRVQNLSEGGHGFTATLPGYAPADGHFNVITGETTKIVVQMVAV